jgi:hypothetical protein
MIIISILSTTVMVNFSSSISGVESDDDKVKFWSATITYDKSVVHIEGAGNGNVVLARLRVKSVGSSGQSTPLTMSGVTVTCPPSLYHSLC